MSYLPIGLGLLLLLLCFSVVEAGSRIEITMLHASDIQEAFNTYKPISPSSPTPSPPATDAPGTTTTEVQTTTTTELTTTTEAPPTTLPTPEPSPGSDTFSSDSSGETSQHQGGGKELMVKEGAEPPIARGETAPPPGPDFFWTGGDSDTSIKLNDKYTLFIFGDTLLGSYNEERNARECAPVFSGGSSVCDRSEVAYMPHSSLGVLDHETKKVTYHWGADGYSYFQPPWATRSMDVFQGTAVSPLLTGGDKFCVFGMWYTFPKKEVNTTWVVCLEGVAASPQDPSKWTQRWSQFPGTGYNYGVAGNIGFHSAVFGRGSNPTSNIFIFGGYVPPGSTGWRFSSQVLAKCNFQDLLDFSWKSLQKWTGKGFVSVQVTQEANGTLSADWSGVKELWGPRNTEFTIFYSVALGRYIQYVLPPYAQYVFYRTSFQLEGPWSDLVELNVPLSPPNSYFAQDSRWVDLLTNSTIMCYAPKVHLSLVDRDLPLNNSFSLFQPPTSFWPPIPPQQVLGREMYVVSYVCTTPESTEMLYADNYAEIFLPYFSFFKVEQIYVPDGTPIPRATVAPGSSGGPNQPSSSEKTVTIVAVVCTLCVVVVIVGAVLKSSRVCGGKRKRSYHEIGNAEEIGRGFF